MDDNILEVKNLTTSFKVDEGKVKAVDKVSFDLKRGKVLGIVGESGCGKSITAMSIMGLVGAKNGLIENGQVLFEGKNLLDLNGLEINKVRGNEISMIFQEPMISLNPVLKIGDQIGEILKVHKNIIGAENKKRVLEMLRLVGIKREEEILNVYPHQLSGGMCQRVMIAMALACTPKLLIADEPTTALDVTVQSQVLELINDIKDKFEMSVMFITHDLGVICEVADEVMVMYAGSVVEKAPIEDIFDNPKHPYTIGLINSRPENFKKGEPLKCINGKVPKLSEISEGCLFSDRCDYVKDICKINKPKLKAISEGHDVRCFRYDWKEEGKI
ncbi:ABC transporter ATP-binding protein [Clostridium frigidicarnis]|uniref:Peptide/nickel transport system ATP-binding protein n=1 Tax=Clostridium frigidicarnis TaxID=84698 RepID=A0A1I1AUE2_9CLOT|nr:ABC transporter ATP-binding protein [Clostridium frigidicarnis]SFB40058.1 peptide/nickel transport system ATP-binding protein [Clostridium frigidicarnis]